MNLMPHMLSWRWAAGSATCGPRRGSSRLTCTTTAGSSGVQTKSRVNFATLPCSALAQIHSVAAVEPTTELFVIGGYWGTKFSFIGLLGDQLKPGRSMNERNRLHNPQESIASSQRSMTLDQRWTAGRSGVSRRTGPEERQAKL